MNVYQALKTYFVNDGDKASCIGFFEGDEAKTIRVIDSSTIEIQAGYSYYNITQTYTTLTKRAVLFFVNPKLLSNTGADCIG